MQLTLTGQNRQPYFADIIILPDSVPYIELLTVTLHDGRGKNNEQADYGETISLSFELANRGTTPSDSLHLKLVSADLMMDLLDSTGIAGPANPLSVFQSPKLFSILLADSIKNAYTINFRLEIQNKANQTWKHYFNIPVHAPDLSFGNYSVDDRMHGNGNGNLDPGERASLRIRVWNRGSSVSKPVTAALKSIPGQLGISDSTLTAGILPPFSAKDLVYELSADSAVAKGSWLKLPIRISSPPYELYDTIDLQVGIVFEDFESASMGIYPWRNDSIIPWEINSLSTHEGSFSARSGLCQDFDTTVLAINLSSTTDDSISFYYRVSSESEYDFFRFFMDGEQINFWSGEHAWQHFIHPVPAGNHSFRWMYTKDKSLAKGADAAWIDFIEFPEGSFSRYNPGIMDILSPKPGQPFPLEDPLKIRIRNFGTSAIDSLAVVYTVNDTLVARDTLFNTMQSSDSYDYTFERPLQFAPGQIYEMKVYTDYPMDEFRANDTLAIIFTSENHTDAGLLRFESPVKGTAGFKDAMYISLWIRNEGLLEIEDIRLDLFLDGLLLFEDSIKLKLNPGDTTLFSFKDALTLFEPGPYRISISAKTQFDLNPINDTLSTFVIVDTVTDASLSSIVSPEAYDSVFTDSETVSIRIHNDGNYLITRIPVTLGVDGNTTVQETIYDTLHPFDSLLYTFLAGADLSGYGIHELLVFTTYPGDRIRDNDSILQHFEHKLLPSSLPAYKEPGHLSVFPNPAPGKFRISIAGAARGVIRIEVHDAQGKQIRHSTIMHSGGRFNSILDLEDFPDGLYLLRIQSGDDIHSVYLINQ